MTSSDHTSIVAGVALLLGEYAGTTEAALAVGRKPSEIEKQLPV